MKSPNRVSALPVVGAKVKPVVDEMLGQLDKPTGGDRGLRRYKEDGTRGSEHSRQGRPRSRFLSGRCRKLVRQGPRRTADGGTPACAGRPSSGYEPKGLAENWSGRLIEFESVVRRGGMV